MDGPNFLTLNDITVPARTLAVINFHNDLKSTNDGFFYDV